MRAVLARIGRDSVALLGLSSCGVVDDGPRFDFPMCIDVGADVAFDTVPTWADDVAPIVMTHCSACHRPEGSGPFSLTSFEVARPWAKAMASAMQARTMPPGGPTSCGDCNTFRDAPWVPAEDIAVVRAWAEGDTPAGDLDAVPDVPPMPAGLDRVDQQLSVPEPYTPVGDGSDDYRCFVITPSNSEDVFLTGFDVLPGDPQLVHHVILYTLPNDAAAEAVVQLDADEAGSGFTCFGDAGVSGAKFTAGWAPGQRAIAFPEGTGVRIPAGRPAVLQVHYNLATGSRPDQSVVRLRTEPEVRVEALLETYAYTGFRLEPGQSYVQDEQFYPQIRSDYDGDITVWGIAPHMHELGRTLSVEVWNDTEHQCVVDMATWDFNAQGLYFFDEPLVVKGTDRMRLTCGWDTRRATGVVQHGAGTGDEMCVAIVYGSAGLPTDAGW